MNYTVFWCKLREILFSSFWVNRWQTDEEGDFFIICMDNHLPFYIVKWRLEKKKGKRKEKTLKSGYNFCFIYFSLNITKSYIFSQFEDFRHYIYILTPKQIITLFAICTTFCISNYFVYKVKKWRFMVQLFHNF